MTTTEYDASLLERIAAALERLSPPAPATPDFGTAQAFVWMADGGRFVPVPKVNRVPLGLLKGIDRTAATLLENTRRFAAGLPANNALLWGARGMGKSSLVKAAHAEVAASPSPRPLRGEGHGGAVPPARGEGQQKSTVQAAAPHPNPLPMTSAASWGEGTFLSLVCRSRAASADPRAPAF